MTENFPFSAILGQEAMQTALLLCAVDPAIGGVLVRGQKGTAKSTAARALASLADRPPERRPIRRLEVAQLDGAGPRRPPPDCPDLGFTAEPALLPDRSSGGVLPVVLIRNTQ